MKSIRSVVIDALDSTIGIRSNPVFFDALTEGRDIELVALEVDSLTRFETLMQIEEALDIEIDDDEMMAQETLDGLIRYVEALAGRTAEVDA